MNRKNHASVVRLTSLALLAALVVVLQTVASGIRIGPVPISLTLVPIVVDPLWPRRGSRAWRGVRGRLPHCGHHGRG
jgi:thiamine transporter ThiT